MTYALQADMANEFGNAELIQLCDRVNGAALDAAALVVLGAALTRADSEINSYVSQRYLLPFVTVPTRLRDVACDIARYYLYDTRAPAVVTARYTAAVAWLAAVAANKALVGVDAASSVIPTDQSQAITVLASDQVFTDDLFCLQ